MLGIAAFKEWETKLANREVAAVYPRRTRWRSWLRRGSTPRRGSRQLDVAQRWHGGGGVHGAVVVVPNDVRQRLRFHTPRRRGVGALPARRSILVKGHARFAVLYYWWCVGGRAAAMCTSIARAASSLPLLHIPFLLWLPSAAASCASLSTISIVGLVA
jgi:hypothetical protein